MYLALLGSGERWQPVKLKAATETANNAQSAIKEPYSFDFIFGLLVVEKQRS